MRKTKKYTDVTNADLTAATGKNWQQWLTLLDRCGARDMAHQSIAELLSVQHKLDGWRAQMVTAGYAQARGLRQVLQRADGFAATISRTVNAKLGALYEAFADEARRLEKSGHTVRRSNEGKTLRLNLDDGSTLEMNLSGKGGQSQVRVAHRQLASAKQAKESKAFWRLTLDDLQAKLAKLG